MSPTFGVNVSTGTDGDPVAAAEMAEQLGFDFVSASDHPGGTHPTYETWTMLTWIAARTTRIRIATRVLGVPYRNPALTAKMAESLYRLSQGRLILGLGGGASDDEFRAFGLPVPSPRDKVDGLGEAIEIARGLWSRPAFTYDGRIHRTAEADIEPKPERRIPIWLGTFGPRALDLTGRLADGWIPSLGYRPDDELPAMRARMLDAAVATGRSPADITCALNMHIETTDGLVERLNSFIELGFSAFNFVLGGENPADQLKSLAGGVIPAVRDS